MRFHTAFRWPVRAQAPSLVSRDGFLVTRKPFLVTRKPFLVARFFFKATFLTGNKLVSRDGFLVTRKPFLVTRKPFLVTRNFFEANFLTGNRLFSRDRLPMSFQFKDFTSFSRTPALDLQGFHVISKGPGFRFLRISRHFQGPRPWIFKDFT